MSLNIRDEETRKLADDLAQLTGETVTGAITVALKERLEREREVEARAQELLEIGRRCAQLLNDGPSAEEHGKLLYDDQGPAQVIVDTSAILAIEAA